MRLLPIVAPNRPHLTPALSPPSEGAERENDGGTITRGSPESFRGNRRADFRSAVGAFEFASIRAIRVKAGLRSLRSFAANEFESFTD